MTRILNLGHRGTPVRAPENTIPSFRGAIEAGADGIELDVRLSRDGHPVVIHNRTLDKTTSGSGPVSRYTLEELRALDAGAWFSPGFTGIPIPTLEDVIESLPDWAFINIETKGASFTSAALDEKVVRLIERFNLFDRVIVSSFNPLSIRRVKVLNGRISVGLLYLPGFPVSSRFGLAGFKKPDALHPHVSLVTERYIARARSAGFRLFAWTVDAPSDLKRMIALGVDGIITNRPDLLHQIQGQLQY